MAAQGKNTCAPQEDIMPERGSDKHGPRQDDELKHELHGLEQADRRVRAEEWRDPEPPADDDPASYTPSEPDYPAAETGAGSVSPDVGIVPQTVSDAMTRRVIALSIDASVTDAAIAMKDNDIGEVVVVHEGAVRGVVTDRDLTVRVVAEKLDPARTPIEEVCSEEVITVRPDAPVDEAVGVMRTRALRRLPVVDEDMRPLGVLSLGDVAVSRQPESPLADISAAPPNR
jgi:CBS domain-containing protein